MPLKYLLTKYLHNSNVTTPVCSPSRTSLLTSQYAYELGIKDWININPKAKTLSGHQHGLGLDSQNETWPEIHGKETKQTGLTVDVLTNRATSFLKRYKDQPFALFCTTALHTTVFYLLL